MSVNDPPLPDWYLALDKGPTIVGVITSMTALATIFVAGRVFVKGRMLHTLGLDDLILVVSLAFGWLAVAFSVVAVRSGDGRHIESLTSDQISGAIFWTMVGFFPSVLSISIPKFAVVMLLIKLLNPTEGHRTILWIMVTASGLGMCGCMVILWAQCTPTSAQWDIELEKKCWDIWILINYSQTASALAGVVDLYLALYPAVILYSLQLHWKKKTALSSALGIGVIASATAWYKASTLVGLSSHDFTWDTCDLTMWTCIEGSTIIIAACIPLLQPLLDLILGRRTLTSQDKSTNRRYYKQDDSKDGRKVELSTYTYRAHPRRRDKSDIDTAILNSHIDEGSQESILNGASGVLQKKSAMIETDAVVLNFPIQGESSGSCTSPKNAPQIPDSTGIVRTDEVRVEYDTNDGTGGETIALFRESHYKVV